MKAIVAWTSLFIMALHLKIGSCLQKIVPSALIDRGNGVRSRVRESGRYYVGEWGLSRSETACRRGLSRNYPLHVSPSSLSSLPTSTLVTALTPWYQDDLPNILGINPLEAAVIFGALYYFYGPTTLYKYTREAGVFFSTYAPIVKDVVSDIFNEFRDYLDEDREREDLKNAGVNIDNIPRRTTNIIERFQDSLDTFSEMSSSFDGASSGGVVVTDDDSDDELSYVTDSSTNNPVDRDNVTIIQKGTVTRKDLVREKQETTSRGGETTMKKKRRTKKEVFDEEVSSAQASTVFDENGYQDEVDRSLAQSVNTIKDQFDILQQRSAADATETMAAGTASSGIGVDNALMAQQMQVQAMMAARREQEAEIEASTAKNRFAAQLSGEWNTKVMNDASPSGSYSSVSGSEVATAMDPSQNVVDTYGWPDMDMDFGPRNGADSSTRISDIPDMVSGGDAIPVSDEAPSYGTSDSLLYENTLDDDKEQSGGNPHAAVDMLKEFDRDYQSLRQRLVHLIESQKEVHGGNGEGDESDLSSTSASKGADYSMKDSRPKQYWPPTKSQDY